MQPHLYTQFQIQPAREDRRRLQRPRKRRSDDQLALLQPRIPRRLFRLRASQRVQRRQVVAKARITQRFRFGIIRMTMPDKKDFHKACPPIKNPLSVMTICSS